MPVRLEDAPSFLNFPGEHSRVLYGEGIFVGYRGYDARALEVTYPFGHGLSYTTFRYANLDATVEGDDVVVCVAVTNVGARDGREVVQVYAAKPRSAVARPPQELRAFDVVDVPRGATRTVTLRIPREDLAYWDDRVDKWIVEGGDYTLRVGRSSRDILCSTVVHIEGDDVQIPLTSNSTLGEILADSLAGPRLIALFQQHAQAATEENSLGTDIFKMIESVPLNRLKVFGGADSQEAVEQILREIAE